MLCCTIRAALHYVISYYTRGGLLKQRLEALRGALEELLGAPASLLIMFVLFAILIITIIIIILIIIIVIMIMIIMIHYDCHSLYY